MHHTVLEKIIDHIEAVLNRPIQEFLKKFNKNKRKSRM